MHSKLALEAGLSASVIDDIREGRPPAGMSEDETAVYNFCCEAHATGRVADDAFLAIKDRFGLDGALDLLALNGYYTLMAMVLNTAGLPLPANADPPL
jgi:4-carboxymuconolactone decarboxylase